MTLDSTRMCASRKERGCPLKPSLRTHRRYCMNARPRLGIRPVCLSVDQSCFEIAQIPTQVSPDRLYLAAVMLSLLRSKKHSDTPPTARYVIPHPIAPLAPVTRQTGRTPSEALDEATGRDHLSLQPGWSTPESPDVGLHAGAKAEPLPNVKTT